MTPLLTLVFNSKLLPGIRAFRDERDLKDPSFHCSFSISHCIMSKLAPRGLTGIIVDNIRFGYGTLSVFSQHKRALTMSAL
jgi:hypothetical protein